MSTKRLKQTVYIAGIVGVIATITGFYALDRDVTQALRLLQQVQLFRGIKLDPVTFRFAVFLATGLAVVSIIVSLAAGKTSALTSLRNLLRKSAASWIRVTVLYGTLAGAMLSTMWLLIAFDLANLTLIQQVLAVQIADLILITFSAWVISLLWLYEILLSSDNPHKKMSCDAIPICQENKRTPAFLLS